MDMDPEPAPQSAAEVPIDAPAAPPAEAMAPEAEGHPVVLADAMCGAFCSIAGRTRLA